MQTDWWRYFGFNVRLRRLSKGHDRPRQIGFTPKRRRRLAI